MSERGLTGEQLDAPFLVIRGVDDPTFEGRWMPRAQLRKIIRNPFHEYGGFWVGSSVHQMWVWPTDEIETNEAGEMAQVCRPLDPDAPEMARLLPPR